MENKHTPGPWHVSMRSQYSVEAKESRGIASTGGYSSNVDSENVYNENIANAKLIAAAPELLEALQNLANYTEALYMIHFKTKLPEHHAIINAARAAIQKATL